VKSKNRTAALPWLSLILTSFLLLSGCSASSLSTQYEEGSNKGYISADGTVAEWPEAERSDPVDFTGVTDTGETLTASDYRGSVVVLNFWYAGCPPCRAEAPDLQELNEAYAGQKVAFIGVNVRDQASTALSFSEEFGITYPSILDTEDKSASLALARSSRTERRPNDSHPRCRREARVPDPRTDTQQIRARHSDKGHAGGGAVSGESKP
jgi:thiol-disulfide isomerase/thioredoxin